MDKVTIGGVNFDVLTMTDTLKFIDEKIKENNSAHYVHTANIDHLVLANSNPDFMEIINAADLVTADGMPIVWVSSLFGKKLPERVTGADLTVKLCEESGRKNYNIFFLGAKPGVALKAKTKLEAKYPDIKIVGVYSPSSNELSSEAENKKIINMINESSANILLVALGAPKQEKWINDNLHQLKTIINIGVGASIDFLAGEQKRAPLFFQKTGFEWFYRMMSDPKRLIHRYLVNDSKIVFILIRSLLKGWKTS